MEIGFVNFHWKELEKKQRSDHCEPFGMAGDEDAAASECSESKAKRVRDFMHEAIHMKKKEIVDATLGEFLQGYISLAGDNRHELLVTLARDYSVNRNQVRELIQQYLGLEISEGMLEHQSEVDEGGILSAVYRTERNLRQALKPLYEILFERLNTYPGGLKFLSILRADLLNLIEEVNLPSLRALDSYLKEKLVTWLSPAVLELHRITWDDSASLLEKIVAYEAVHPINNLQDLKRRLGVGRRCFGYLHPAIPCEPLIFIEVALLKDVAHTIQEVLWDEPPILENDATCALFYSISSTQPGLSGINLGKFLIKRVIELVRRDMPCVLTFATLSPIPGYIQWLLSKLASQLKLAELDSEDKRVSSEDMTARTFRENLLYPEEEQEILASCAENPTGNSAVEVMLCLLRSRNPEWVKSDRLLAALQAPLMRLCSRYLVREKKRGKALDAVANFHLQNGAMIHRLNWMADRSEKGFHQSGGIMVNYLYRPGEIEENAQLYFNSGHIQASPDIQRYLELDTHSRI
ncbi:malonyl-CoA decarboxylase, mitochondrial isoform X2 [Amborella trichopoda]|uniref:malonyl-CoA decarboxylase, mitochondrial isoform X2 n=1 Tax=Amborella trichopoda TaxID=13333 RepID=UPI0009BF16E3|nr:malonyl-CoA decarboxylase, mitochondrial isoform X2 [Amborella trichopoda]|eukprot:XP_020523376.1 malonyl-CoA decarboxylase, mitochondrial isoform X2 [Amborella trichopoda]